MLKTTNLERVACLEWDASWREIERKQEKNSNRLVSHQEFDICEKRAKFLYETEILLFLV